jgi:hypothetical protein
MACDDYGFPFKLGQDVSWHEGLELIGRIPSLTRASLSAPASVASKSQTA